MPGMSEVERLKKCVIEPLEKQIAGQQARIEKLVNLLKYCHCPRCNDSGIFARMIASGVYEPEPCQWCRERSAALAAAEKEKK